MSSIEIIDNFLPDEIFYNFAEILMRNSIYQPLDYTGLVSEADGSIRTYGEELVPKNNKSFAEVMFQAVIYSTQVTSATTQNNLMNLEESWKKKVQLLEERNAHLSEELFNKDNEIAKLRSEN